MHWIRPMWSGAVAAVILAAAAHAGAAMLEVHLGGTVTSVDNPAFFDGSIQVGVPFSAVLTLDDAIPDGSPSPDQGRYELTSSNYSLVVTVGSYVGSVSAGTLLIGESPAQDVFFVAPPINGDFAITPAIPGLYSALASLTLEAVPGTALHSDAIVGVPFDASAWTERHLDFSAFANDPIAGFRSSTVSLGIDRMWVPEPAASVLLAIGLCGLGARRRP